MYIFYKNITLLFFLFFFFYKFGLFPNFNLIVRHPSTRVLIGFYAIVEIFRQADICT